MLKRNSFAFQLLKNFLFSTFIPFLLATTILVRIYSNTYEKDVELLLNSTMNSITSNIVTYLDDISQYTLLPYYNGDLYNYLRTLSKGNASPFLERLPLQNNLDSNMSFVRFTRQDINGIFIVNDNRCLYNTVNHPDNKTVAENFHFSSLDWYHQAIAADGRRILMGPHYPEYIRPHDSSVISVIRSIVALETREPLYVIKIDINTSIFNRIFKNFSFHVNSKIILQDEHQQIIYANAPLPAEDQKILTAGTSDSVIRLSDGAWSPYTYTMEEYPWNVTVLLSNTEIHNKTIMIYLAAFLFYVSGLMLAILSHTVSSKRMVRSINQMKLISRSIRKGDFSQNYDYQSNTELDNLGHSLVHMAKQLEEKIQKEYIMTIEQKNIEFKALQSQIQPHFLFNTLNNFIALNQTGNREALENALFNLSEMLRYLLKAPAIIPLSTELECVRDYCALQKLRFGERLNYSLEIRVAADQIMIPKLLLQPIVENSIIHGIEPSAIACSISITAEWDEDTIVLTVADTGIGFQLQTHSEEHIGLKNVQDRLHIFSPESTCSITSEPGRGTTTIIRLPQSSGEE